MWNLFSVAEPKVLKPSRSLKQQLLQNEAFSLQQIEQQARKMLSSINTVLKIQSSPENEPIQKFKSSNKHIVELQMIIDSLHERIGHDNMKFDSYITGRDQQKINYQEFFKSTMKSYEQMKISLNKHIEQLEDKVQQLEQKGHYCYEMSPKPNNVLAGINQNYIDKYLTKLHYEKKIQQTICSLLLQNKLNKSSQKNLETPMSNLQDLSPVQQRVTLFRTEIKCDSLNDLQRQLQMILLKENIIGQMLDSKIKTCKKKFKKLAAQETFFKQAIKKAGVVKEQRRRSSAKLSITRKGFLQKPHVPFKKASSFFVSNSSKAEERSQSLNLSFDQDKLQNDSNSNENHANQIDQELQAQNNCEESPYIPSQNFIQACEYLITERFIQGEQDEQKAKDDIFHLEEQ